MSRTIHIIGAGLSGLCAALEASQGGFRVEVYEAAPHAGGRCRSYHDKTLGTKLDNGNHLVLGANHAVIAYLAQLGTLPLCLTDNDPCYFFLDLKTNKHWQTKPPFHVKGILATEWCHLLRLVLPAPHKTVADCIPEHTTLYHRLIEPLCLAMLNTSPKAASAAMFAAILRSLILGGKTAWRAFVPSPDLSSVFVNPALAHIRANAGTIYLSKPVKSLGVSNNQVNSLIFHERTIHLGENDRVICAVSPQALGRLIPELAVDFEYESILNAHFLWSQESALCAPMPFIGVLNGVVQWIFAQDGRISTTTSAACEWMDTDEQTLASLLWQDVCRAFYLKDTPCPPYRIIKEKRATIAATPHNLALRPSMITPYDNLLLAGDYLASSLPATLEAAIRSGQAAARKVMESLHAQNLGSSQAVKGGL